LTFIPKINQIIKFLDFFSAFISGTKCWVSESRGHFFVQWIPTLLNTIIIYKTKIFCKD
jgi:hypothetical protein